MIGLVLSCMQQLFVVIVTSLAVRKHFVGSLLFITSKTIWPPPRYLSWALLYLASISWIWHTQILCFLKNAILVLPPLELCATLI